MATFKSKYHLEPSSALGGGHLGILGPRCLIVGWQRSSRELKQKHRYRVEMGDVWEMATWVLVADNNVSDRDREPPTGSASGDLVVLGCL